MRFAFLIMMFTMLVLSATESAKGTQKKPDGSKPPPAPHRKPTRRPSVGGPAQSTQQQQQAATSSQTKSSPVGPAKQQNTNSKPAQTNKQQPAKPAAVGAPGNPAATGRGLKAPTPTGTSSPSGPPSQPGGGPPSTPAFQPVDHGNGVVQTGPNNYLNVNTGRTFSRHTNNPNPVQYLGRNRQGERVWYNYDTNQFTAPPPQASGSAGAGSSTAGGAGSSSAATSQGEDRPNSNYRLIEHVKNMIARGYTMGPDGQWRRGGRDGSELRRFD
ncbi:hypothetical protein MP228_000839 [Amoeboaphelidium protococcarum]|nr:hypothetical protein MP228_000839 [Amoeboaphelidium protococcarum]